MYADQNENWGPTLFYSTCQPASGADTFDTISTISSPSYVGSPYVGFVTNEYNLTYSNYDALTPELLTYSQQEGSNFTSKSQGII